MENWRNKPTAIDNASTGTKLALFIDESGNPMYKGSSETNRYFTLCGCLFTLPELKNAQDKMLALKGKYWVNGEFAYKEGCQRVTFHMAEIAQARKGFKNKNNPFSYIEENIASFYLEYKQLVRELDFFVFSVTVDKLAMQRRYHHPYDPVCVCLRIIAGTCTPLRSTLLSGILRQRSHYYRKFWQKRRCDSSQVYCRNRRQRYNISRQTMLFMD